MKNKYRTFSSTISNYWITLVKMLKKNQLWILLSALVAGIIYSTMYATLGAITRGNTAFRAAETSIIVFLCLMVIAMGFMEAHLTRFEFSPENYRRWMHLIPLLALVPLTFGNWAWIIFLIIFQISIVPFAVRSTLAKIPGISCKVSLQLIDPELKESYAFPVLAKPLTTHNILEETPGDTLIFTDEDGNIEEYDEEPIITWKLTEAREHEAYLKKIPKKYLELAEKLYDHFRTLTVYYTEDMYDPNEKMLLYRFASQPLDENTNLFDSKLIMGYTGLKDDEFEIAGAKYYGYKCFVFDIIPILQQTGQFLQFPNSELLEYFCKTMLTWDRHYNKQKALEEENDLLRRRLNVYDDTFDIIKTESTEKIRQLQNMLALHGNELGLEDANIIDMTKKPPLTERLSAIDRDTWIIIGVIAIAFYIITILALISG